MSILRDVLPGVPVVESPLFEALIDKLQFTVEERRIATELHDRGYAVIDFPDEELTDRIDRIQRHLSTRFDVNMNDPAAVKNLGCVQRVQDAWAYHDDVRALAANPGIIGLLSKLYGRRAFPFQTLNFPVGTQQHLHSDSIHFSSIPERFMCGVWLAMEDVTADAGPLTYIPGSHKWPILSNAMIGREGSGSAREFAQEPFECAWNAIVQHTDAEQEIFLAQKGQALIWAANLLHGGSPQKDPCLTRWSQVTHYYFENCAYYTPAFSDEALGRIDFRVVVDVATEELQPNRYLGREIEFPTPARPSTSLVSRLRERVGRAGLPSDFDPNAYYRLNPDVATARLDAAEHYLTHGKNEGRRYRYR